jgi:ATP-dependent Lhr-like helicase
VDVQRNLLTPIAEMGLDIRVETRTGDTPSDRKTRQRIKPPQILLTTPESLSLLLSHEDSFGLFGDLSTIVVDEIHAFASGKRGDLLSLAMARLQRIAPNLRRVGLSATVSDPEAYQGWLSPDAMPKRWTWWSAIRARRPTSRSCCPRMSAFPGPATPGAGRPKT